MKKIKIVVSDLHLGQGSILPSGVSNPLEEFHFDEKFREFLHYYSSGEYEDYEVELVINGDFLNFIQMPYNGHYLTVITEDVSLYKLENVIKGHPKFFKALSEFAQQPNRTITYIVGNHDQGMLWPKTRDRLNEILKTNVKYKNIVYYFDGVHIEHGHMYESANRIDPKKFFLKKNLPEPILNLPFGSHFFIDVVMRLKFRNPHVDKVRPFYHFIRWGLFFETILTLKALAYLLVYFARSAFAHDSRQGWSPRRLLQVLFEGAVFPDLSHAARRILKDERVHTVIFGHSHVYQYRQWGENKEYFNTGTWTEVTSLDAPSLGKITKLTYVLIEYIEPQQEEGGENTSQSKQEARPRGRLKEWRGYHRIEEDVVIA